MPQNAFCSYRCWWRFGEALLLQAGSSLACHPLGLLPACSLLAACPRPQRLNNTVHQPTLPFRTSMVVLLPRNEALKHDGAQDSLTLKTYHVNADVEVDGSNHYDEDNHFEEQSPTSSSQPRGMRSTEPTSKNDGHDDFASHNHSLCGVDIYTRMRHRPAEQAPQQPTTTTTTTPPTHRLLLRLSRLSSPCGALAVTDACQHAVPAQSHLSNCPAVVALFLLQEFICFMFRGQPFASRS